MTPILDNDLGYTVPIQPQVYVNPILEVIGTPKLTLPLRLVRGGGAARPLIFERSQQLGRRDSRGNQVCAAAMQET